MDPRQMKRMMKQMGIDSKDIDAKRVIIETESSNIIIENIANNNEYGIHLEGYCALNTISGNYANNNSEYGILLFYNCDVNNITGNVANNNDFGIGLDYFCDRNNISENTANENVHLLNKNLCILKP